MFYLHLVETPASIVGEMDEKLSFFQRMSQILKGVNRAAGTIKIWTRIRRGGFDLDNLGEHKSGECKYGTK